MNSPANSQNIQPSNKKKLALIYGVDPLTLNKWINSEPELKKIFDEVKANRLIVLTPAVVAKVFEILGPPPG